MKTLLLCCFLAFASGAFAQEGKSISVIDFVRIKNEKSVEAFYFYENNWKVYRDLALQKGYIQAYRMLRTGPDSLILITQYADSGQFKNSEANFNRIIKEVRPDGPKLMNALKPGDFRENLFSKVSEEIFSGGR